MSPHYLYTPAYCFFVSCLSWIQPRPHSSIVKWFRTLYNMAMSLFSTWMLVGIVQANLHADKLSSLDAIICKPYPGSEAESIVHWFLISKYFEWFDTLFLRLGGRPISWLQYTHHATTGILAYLNSRHYVNPYFFPFMASNCLVHTLMYWYFAFPKGFLRPWRRSITRLQIAQHVMCVATLLYSYQAESCHQDPAGHLAAIVCYTMYLGFFTAFYIKDKLKRC